MDVDTSAMALDMSEATMQISVEQNGDLLRKVIERRLDDLTPVTPANKKFQIGVYLPAHVSGDVTVVVVIVDKNGCSIGTGNTVTVTVTAGAASTAPTVTVTITEPSCPGDGGISTPPADAGLDTQEAGQPTTDAASDTTAPATDTAGEVYCPPDAPVEATPPPTCEEFCDMATKKCPTFYNSVDSCMGACKPWAAGTVSNGSMNGFGENTIGCRLYWVMHFVANMAETYCAAAAPNSSRCTQ